MKYKFLDLLEKGQITPNFWCAEEYFDKAKLIEVYDVQAWGMIDRDWGLVFPLLLENGAFDTSDYGEQGERIWSDFPEWINITGSHWHNWKSKFLDYEYIYDPKAFLFTEGGQWAVFRKNCRKWIRQFMDGSRIRYDWVPKVPKKNLEDLNEALSDVLDSWLKNKPVDKEIFDDEVLTDYLFHGENRKILHINGKIYGINIWDENYKHINFRYCICRPEEYLSEYMRRLFYTDPFIQEKNKLVNDGGVLDNPNLKRFKDKMNPLRVRKVYSWFKMP